MTQADHGGLPRLTQDSFQKFQEQKHLDLFIFGSFKCRIVLDPTLPSGVMEMRTEGDFVRVFNVGTEAKSL